MAPARVRGCAGLGPPPAGSPARQADASRRRNGPRKATSRRLITVRLRGKSCPAGGPDVPRAGRRAVVAQGLRTPQQADVGSKTRSAGRVPPQDRAEGGSQWTSSSRVGTRTCWIGSASTRRPSSPRSGSWITRRSDRRGGLRRAQSAPVGAAGARRADHLLARAGHPGRGRGRGPLRRAGPGAAKLESRLRRAGDRRKARKPGARSAPPSAGAGGRRPRRAAVPASRPGAWIGAPDGARPRRGRRGRTTATGARDRLYSADGVVPIQMEGDGPLVVREKFHAARPMTIDQALLEMELVGHDFFLFWDDRAGRPASSTGGAGTSTGSSAWSRRMPRRTLASRGRPTGPGSRRRG